MPSVTQSPTKYVPYHPRAHSPAHPQFPHFSHAHSSYTRSMEPSPTVTSPSKSPKKHPGISVDTGNGSALAPSPTLQRTKSKGKERQGASNEKDKDRRTREEMMREIGSATISLRVRAVEGLVNENDDAQPRSSSFCQTQAQQPRPSSSFASRPKERRCRSNSLHVPSRPSSADRSFYLPHHSLDQTYSLPKGKKEKGKDVHTPKLELGLGEDFNTSFGEAMRLGTQGEEMPLPKEALMMLSHAKEQIISTVGVKQGRKGSMGMGLFKESRAVGAPIKDGKKVLDDVVFEEHEPGDEGRSSWKDSQTKASASGYIELRERSGESGASSPVPIRGVSKRRHEGVHSSESNTLRSPSSGEDSPTEKDEQEDEGDSSVEDDESWTTTSTESFTSDAEGDDRDWMSEGDRGSEERDDEDRMTVPLQPFSHAVGGHSSIYKFTRRAVCKPLVSHENLFYEEVERLAPALLSFIPRYLGVMVVNYRLQRPSTEGTPTPVDSPCGPTPFSSQPSTPCLPPQSAARRPMLQQALTGTSTQSHISVQSTREGVEIPEVSLDFNRHVVPGWLFKREERSGRGRSRPWETSDDDGTKKTLRPSSAKSQEFARYGSGSPGSSWHSSAFYGSPGLRAPALGSPAMPKAIQETHNDVPSTPAPSPSTSYQRDSHLHHTASTPALNRRRASHLSGDLTGGLHSPHLFGGTGSTTVNTKLKDHVFATILKKLRRKGIGHRHDDEADDEGEDYGSLRSNRHRRRNLSGGGGSMDIREPPEADEGIRRTQSDVVLTERHGKTRRELSPRLRAREESEERGIFDMEVEDDPPLEINRRGRVPLGNALHPMTAVKNEPDSTVLAEDRPPFASAPPSAPVSINRSAPASSPLPNSEPVTRQELFIFMEDLTGRVKHPCVLDLKMGTRQYGYDATPMKKRSQRKKCDTTTSRTLGVRMCGMQVWNNDTQSFVSQNKYRGREIRTPEFKSVIRAYLSDGDHLLIDHIPVLFQKLYDLAAIIYQLDGFRFYGCSLLFIYDGEKEMQSVYCQQIQSEKLGSLAEEDEAPSLGKGLGQPDDRTWPGRPTGRSTEEKGKERRNGHVSKSRSRSRPRESQTDSHTHHHRKLRGEVNVRVVDFAHTTTGRDFMPFSPDYKDPPDLGKGYDTPIDEATGMTMARFPPKHPGKPDMGFMFGLKSICESLSEIWREEMGDVELEAKSNGDVFDVAFLSGADLST